MSDEVLVFQAAVVRPVAAAGRHPASLAGAQHPQGESVLRLPRLLLPRTAVSGQEFRRFEGRHHISNQVLAVDAFR